MFLTKHWKGTWIDIRIKTKEQLWLPLISENLSCFVFVISDANVLSVSEYSFATKK